MSRTRSAPATGRATGLVLFGASGFTALVYEVLWLKQLALLFGSTAYASATTLAVFFGGLALGSYVWGSVAPRVRNPLRLYAGLEVGIAASALLYFALLDAYYAFYGLAFRELGVHPIVLTAVKVLLAAGVLLPPAMLMGGTLPTMAQYLVRRPEDHGRWSSLLYAVNTAGATAGAFAAGFYLPPTLGFTRSYLLAMALNLAIALAAFLASAATATSPLAERASACEAAPRTAVVAPRAMAALAFLSGAVTLSLEVLWTRMFAQVLHNSVYSFALILVMFLVALSLGALVAHVLSRSDAAPQHVLSVVVLLAGGAVGATPFVFHGLTNGLQYLAPTAAWAEYVRAIAASAAMVMLVPAALIGTVFPYLLTLADPAQRGVGRAVGRLAAINTLGAIVGALGAGFVLLTWLGLWASNSRTAASRALRSAKSA
jgi:spermidine synthase